MCSSDLRPVIMILEGWPETSPPPQGPSKTYISEPQTTGITRANANKRRRHEKRRVTIIIGRRAGLQLRLESSEDSGEETAQIRPPHRRTSKGGLER